jgi:hypothetical protein
MKKKIIFVKLSIDIMLLEDVRSGWFYRFRHGLNLVERILKSLIPFVCPSSLMKHLENGQIGSDEVSY